MGFGSLGMGELLLILLIAILLFGGGRKIPELMRSLGEGIREFKKAAGGLTEEESSHGAENSDAEKSEGEKLREAARALGISTDGKTEDQIRQEIASKVKG